MPMADLSEAFQKREARQEVRFLTVPSVFHFFFSFYEVALLELETRARRTGRETSDCNSRERLGRALD